MILDKVISGLAMLAVCGFASAETLASPETLKQMRQDIAKTLKAAPRPSDRSLIDKYKLELREGDIWDAPSPQDGDDPSPGPEGFLLINKQGLQAYIGWRPLPGVKCSHFKNAASQGYLCAAAKADKKAVAAFKVKISIMLNASD